MKYFVPLALILSFALTSCEKKVLEIVPVLQVQKDMSIPGAGDIKYFSFTGGQVGYAASETTFIYKTVNDGDSWDIIEVGNGSACRGLAFFDAERGMALMGSSLFVTYDGGETWTQKDSGVFFCGVSDSGIGAYVKNCNSNFCVVRSTSDQGESFSEGLLNHAEGWYEVVKGKMTGNRIVLIHSDATYDDRVHGYDLDTEESFTVEFNNLTAYEEFGDIYLDGETGVIVADEGALLHNSSGFSFSRRMTGHPFTYHSVDGTNGLIVAVGENMITSNLDIQTESEWNPVFDSDADGFNETFYKIEFFNRNSFYLSGENGRILKVKL